MKTTKDFLEHMLDDDGDCPSGCDVFEGTSDPTPPRELQARHFAEVFAVAQPVVNSVEELDQLPVGSLIMMSGVVAPFLRTDDGWESTRTPGKPVRDYTTNPSYLPATVLHRP